MAPTAPAHAEVLTPSLARQLSRNIGREMGRLQDAHLPVPPKLARYFLFLQTRYPDPSSSLWSREKPRARKTRR